jgi:hypothetical protein
MLLCAALSSSFSTIQSKVTFVVCSLTFLLSCHEGKQYWALFLFHGTSELIISPAFYNVSNPSMLLPDMIIPTFICQSTEIFITDDKQMLYYVWTYDRRLIFFRISSIRISLTPILSLLFQIEPAP